MYSFFVLGQIPGTSIIITFTMWMQLFAALFVTGMLIYLRRTHGLRNYFPPTIGSDPTAQ